MQLLIESDKKNTQVRDGIYPKSVRDTILRPSLPDIESRIAKQPTSCPKLGHDEQTSGLGQKV